MTNTGDEVATGVNLSDTIPANTTLVASSLTVPATSTINSGDTAGDTDIDVDLPDLSTGAGDTQTITFQVTIDDPLAAGVDAIVNQGTVIADGRMERTLPAAPNNDRRRSASRRSRAWTAAAGIWWWCWKDDGGVSIVPGGAVTYTVDYSNVGDQAATGVTITETVPVGSVFVAAATNPWSCADGAVGGTVCTIDLGSVPTSGVGSSGSVAFTVEALDPFPAGLVELDNDVTIGDDGANGTDLTPGDNADDDQTPVTSSPVVSATKDAVEGPVSPGATVTYTVVLTNSGDQDDSGVVFTDTPDPDTTLVAGSVSTSQGTVTTGNTTTPTADSTVAVDVGTLAGDGGSVTITFDVVVDSPFPTPTGTVENQGEVTSDGLVAVLLTDDPDEPGTDDKTPTAVAAAPIVTATKTDTSVDAPVVPGSTISYTVVVENTAAATTAATGVVFSDTPDADTTLDAGSVVVTPAAAGTVTTGNTTTPTPDTGVEVDLGTLTVGESVTITFDVIVDDPVPGGTTQVVNQGIVETNEVPDVPTDDPTPPGTDDPTTTPITAAPILDVDKTDSIAVTSSVAAGDTVTYTITIDNDGNEVATGVNLTDTVPTKTTLVGGSLAVPATSTINSGDTAGDSTIDVDLPDLAPGNAQTITFQVTIDDPLPAGITSVANQATVIADGGLSEPSNDPEHRTR